jgi:hypothetical protein
VYASLKAGKVAEALPYIAEPERGFWEKYLEAAKAVAAYADALDEKFGKDPAFRRRVDLVEGVRDHGLIEVREVKRAGRDKARLTVWKKRPSPGLLEKKVDAVRTETGWKLHLSSPELGSARREVRKAPDGKELVVWVEIEPSDPSFVGTAPDVAKQLFGSLAVEAAKQARAVRAGEYKTRQAAFEELQKRFREQEKKRAPEGLPKRKDKG